MNNHEFPEQARIDSDTSRWLLAVDTSTEQIGLALTDGESIVELSLPGGRQQTTKLLPLIQWLAAQNGMTVGNVGAVAVATGPGSFTGLRVGLSIAKGLSLARKSAVIGIPTLEVIARMHQASAIPLVVIIPAGRSRFVWTSVDSKGRLDHPRNTDGTELIDAVAQFPDHLFTGEIPRSLHDSLLTHSARVESRLLGTRRPAALADLGFARWSQGLVDDAQSLEPMYLHGKQTALPPRSQR